MGSPTVSSISPKGGPFSGGTAVTILGTGFTDTANTAVFFGIVQATSVVVVSPTQITAVSPSSPSGGACYVTVQNQNGSSTTSGSDFFTGNDFFAFTPVLTSLTDINGNPLTEASQVQPGTTIIINGEGFCSVGATLPFEGGVTIQNPVLNWSPSQLPSGSNFNYALQGPTCYPMSDTQFGTEAPAYSFGTWWVAVATLVTFQNSQTGDIWPTSNFLPFTIAEPPPAGPTPNITSVMDANGNVISTVLNGSVFVTETLAPGAKIVLNGVNLGNNPGFINYLLPPAPPGVISTVNLNDLWGDFSEYATISLWSDTAITVTLSHGTFGPYNNQSFEIKAQSANTSSATGAWGNAIYLNVVGPPTYLVIDCITDATGNPIPAAAVNTYIIIHGNNFGTSPGTVEWWTPSTLGDGSLGTLIFSQTYTQTDAHRWTDSEIVALTPTPHQVLGAQAQTGPSQNSFLIRVLDAQGNPNASVPPGTVTYEADLYAFQLTPPAAYIYAVNAADNSISVIDASTLQVAKTIYLGILPLPPETVTSPSLAGGLAGDIISPIAIPMGIATNQSGTRAYVSVQIWRPQQSPSASNTAITWGGVFGLVPSNGLVAVISTDPTQSNYQTIIGWFPVGVNPQGIIVTAPNDPTKPDSYFLYVANVGSLGTFPGNGSVSVIDNSKFKSNPNDPDPFGASDPTSNFAAVTMLQTPAPAVGPGNPPPQIQSPLVPVASPDGNQVFILDGGVLYNTSGTDSNLSYVLVLDTNPASSTANSITSTIAVPGLGFEVQDMVLSPDGTRLYIATLQAVEGQRETNEYHSVVVIDTTQIGPGLNDASSAAIFATLTIEIPNALTNPNPLGSRNPATTTTTASVTLTATGTYSIPVQDAAAFTDGTWILVEDSMSNWIWGQIVNTGSVASAPTTIAPSSYGQSLPGNSSTPYTINVLSTREFPPSGTIEVETSSAYTQLVTYTATTPGSFIACTGGVGTLVPGGTVQLYSSANTFSVLAGSQSSTSGSIASGASVTISSSPPAQGSQSTQQIGINNIGKPTYKGLYTSVSAQGIATSLDGRYLYVSDLFGPVWTIDTAQLQTPGTYNPPQWLFSLLSRQPTVKQLGFGGPFDLDVVSAMNVQGEPNSVVVAPNGVVYVALGGISASGHETVSNAAFDAGAPPLIPGPGNAVAAFGVAFNASGYAIPGLAFSTQPGVPSVTTNIPVGNYPLALAVVQPFPPPGPPPILPSGSGAGALFRRPWFPSWANTHIPVMPILREPQVNVTVGDNGDKQNTPMRVFATNHAEVDWPVSRAEFASVLRQLLKLPQPQKQIDFADIPSRNWAFEPAQALAKYMTAPIGQIKRPCFYPNLPLDRLDAAVIISRLLEAQKKVRPLGNVEERSVLSGVKDAGTIAEPLGKAVAITLKYDLLTLLPDGRFYPTTSLKRSNLNATLGALLRLLDAHTSKSTSKGHRPLKE